MSVPERKLSSAELKAVGKLFGSLKDEDKFHIYKEAFNRFLADQKAAEVIIPFTDRAVIAGTIHLARKALDLDTTKSKAACIKAGWQAERQLMGLGHVRIIPPEAAAYTKEEMRASVESALSESPFLQNLLIRGDGKHETINPVPISWFESAKTRADKPITSDKSSSAAPASSKPEELSIADTQSPSPVKDPESISEPPKLGRHP